MSNRPGRDGADGHTQASKQATASQPGEDPETESGKPSKRRGPVPLKSPQSLERLRDRVKAAARELERLRKENAALAERIRTLEAHPAAGLEGTMLAFDQDPAVLREKIEGFLEAIDKYLARESA